jgi:hypothetical protein
LKPISENSIIEITNMSGQTIISKPFNGNTAKIQCGELSGGIYVLKVISNDRNIISKHKLAIQ